MSGKILRALEKNTYPYTAAAGSQIPFGKAVNIPVAVNLDVSQFLWAGIVLRLHSATLANGSGGGGTPSISANLFNSAPTAEDPGLVFRAPIGSPVITGTTVSLVGATPYLQVDFVSAAGKIGSYCDLFLVVTQYTSGTTPWDITFTASIDLVLKS